MLNNLKYKNMKNEKSTSAQPEKSKSFIDPRDKDTPKPDGEVANTSEEGEETEKPWENS